MILADNEHSITLLVVDSKTEKKRQKPKNNVCQVRDIGQTSAKGNWGTLFNPGVVRKRISRGGTN